MKEDMTRGEAIRRFGLEKVMEVENKDAECDHITLSGEERWVSCLKVTGGWLIAVYYQPYGFCDDNGNCPEDEDVDWILDHFEYEEV